MMSAAEEGKQRKSRLRRSAGVALLFCCNVLVALFLCIHLSQNPNEIGFNVPHRDHAKRCVNRSVTQGFHKTTAVETRMSQEHL